MQEDAHEMGQIVLEFLHGWPLVGLWVSPGFRLHLPLTRKVFCSRMLRLVYT